MSPDLLCFVCFLLSLSLLSYLYDSIPWILLEYNVDKHINFKLKRAEL